MVDGKIKESRSDKVQPETCGVIMPISAMGIYDSAHWADVRRVLYRAIEAAGMNPQIVSDSLETDVIQERIILNLYENPVVICDVSGLNPNVMFELGMRLTFKKPTIIVTDDLSSLPFDTRIIEHLSYPRDLRFHRIEEFIAELSRKIMSIKEKSESGTYKSFIESFGKFETASPERESVPIDKFVLDRLDQISSSVRRLERGLPPPISGNTNRNILVRPKNAFASGMKNVFDSESSITTYLIRDIDQSSLEDLIISVLETGSVLGVSHGKSSSGGISFGVNFTNNARPEDREIVSNILVPYIEF